jgi:hypothetical protein
MVENRIVVHTENGDRRGFMSLEECERYEASGRGFAVRSRRGNIKRFILFPVPSGWRGGSHTTERIRNDWGVVIAPDYSLQHKRVS